MIRMPNSTPHHTTQLKAHRAECCLRIYTCLPCGFSFSLAFCDDMITTTNEHYYYMSVWAPMSCNMLTKCCPGTIFLQSVLFLLGFLILLLDEKRLQKWSNTHTHKIYNILCERVQICLQELKKLLCKYHKRASKKLHKKSNNEKIL